jgi:Tol biopolymer transport system component
VHASTVLRRAVHATYRGENGLIAIGGDLGDGSEIYTVRPDGTELTRLTTVAGAAFDPDWSPDGTKIVFDVNPSGADFPTRIYLMNADGSNVVNLTPKRVIAEHGGAYNPSFTPDGKRIVFVQQRCHNEVECHRTIWSMNLQGGDRRRVLRHFSLFQPGNYDLHMPRVSPDGRTILFVVVDESGIVVNGVEGNRKALYSVRMNGAHMRQIVPFRFDVCTCGGDWAPNGRRIVSSDQIGPTPVPGKPSNLFTVRPDRTGLRYLTDYRASSPDVNLGAGTYSPNGRWIVFKHSDNVNGRYVMWLVHPDGSGLKRIRRFKFSFTTRDWGPRAR